MSHHTPPDYPEPHTTVLFLVQGRVRAGYWSGYDWDAPNANRLYKPHEVNKWWPLPTEEQLDALHDYAVHGHKGEVVARMGPFFCGDDTIEDFGNRHGMLGEDD